jgi:hypothetical protein
MASVVRRGAYKYDTTKPRQDNSSSSMAQSFPPISGGLPTKSQDFVASIVFTIVYTL